MMSCISLMLYNRNLNTFIIAQEIIMSINSFPLMAIPFFMLAGKIMSQIGPPRCIVFKRD